mgnify:CR=1 FL=1
MTCDDTITCHGILIKSNGDGITWPWPWPWQAFESNGHGMASHPMAIGFEWPWHGMASHAMAI